MDRLWEDFFASTINACLFLMILGNSLSLFYSHSVACSRVASDILNYRKWSYAWLSHWVRLEFSRVAPRLSSQPPRVFQTPDDSPLRVLRDCGLVVPVNFHRWEVSLWGDQCPSRIVWLMLRIMQLYKWNETNGTWLRSAWSVTIVFLGLLLRSLWAGSFKPCEFAWNRALLKDTCW